MGGRAQPENGADSPQALADITDPEHSGIALLLDSLESLLIAISQRRMGAGQRERYARLLARAERDAIERGRHDG